MRVSFSETDHKAINIRSKELSFSRTNDLDEILA